MLTPLDLHGKKFEKEFRGYNSKEVDEFFAQVVKDFERLYQDNIELKEALERASTKLEYFEQMEATMHNTLAIAQETAEEVKQSGKKQVELMTKAVISLQLPNLDQHMIISFHLKRLLDGLYSKLRRYF